MKKEWKQPMLEELNIKMTMGGPGLTIPDAVQNDPDEIMHHDS